MENGEDGCSSGGGGGDEGGNAIVIKQDCNGSTRQHSIKGDY